jgi:5,10-methylenetetrahydromethanopterin reductase
MRTGILLGTSGDLGRFRAEAAAARGFGTAWTNQAPGGWDPLTMLTAVGDEPGALGTAVVPTYPRHPVALATEALTVQALTGGRLTLGIGPSHKSAITGWWGIPYTSPAQHTREYLEVLRPLLRGEHVKYAGEFFTVDTELAVTAPEPAVLIGALGPRLLEVARDLADGTIAVWVRPEAIADWFVPRLGDGARIVAVVSVAVTSDPDGVRETYARDFAMVDDLPPYRAMLDRGGLAGPADTLVAGDETTVLRELDRFRDAGLTDMIVVPVGSDRERELVVETVRPR